MGENSTKQKIIEAAIFLFNTKGFDGTSVREIAKRANVNVANISYYFDGKNGLLEYLVADFLEGYVSVIENTFQEWSGQSPKTCLLKIVRSLIYYQRDRRRLARFVHREITLDTVLNRELMTTYLMKEKYYLKALLEAGMKSQEFRKLSIPYTILQLKGMISAPFLNPEYMTEVLHLLPFEEYCTDQYAIELENWIAGTIFCENGRGLMAIPV